MSAPALARYTLVLTGANDAGDVNHVRVTVEARGHAEAIEKATAKLRRRGYTVYSVTSTKREAL